MKVIVTGGSGKLGQYVMDEMIDHGHDALNLDRHDPGKRQHFVKIDLTDAGQLFDAFMMFKPEAVVHLAALPDPFSNPRHEQLMVNIGMAHAAMMAAGDLGVTRFVNASSEMATGWSSVRTPPVRLPFDEEVTTPAPNTYALGKQMVETMADGIVARYPQMAVISLRLNFISMPDRYDEHHKWLSRIAGHPSPNLWTYIDVRDAASACRMAMESAVTGHRVYAVSAEDILADEPIRELVRRHYGDQIQFADDLPEHGSPVDCRRIAEELGWRPQYSWRQGSPKVDPDK